MIEFIAAATFGAGFIAGALALRTWQRRKLIKLPTPKMNLLEARFEMLKSATRRPCVVMLGDSLTAGVPWSELAACPSVANYGWNGDTSDGVLYRLSEIILLRPGAVFLMVGANDILKGTPIAQTAANMRTIVDKLEAENITVVVHPVVPFVGAGRRVDELNRAIFSALVGTRSKLIPLPIDIEDLRDGLHLGPSGAAKWHDTVKPLLERCCFGHQVVTSPLSAGSPISLS